MDKSCRCLENQLFRIVRLGETYKTRSGNIKKRKQSEIDYNRIENARKIYFRYCYNIAHHFGCEKVNPVFASKLMPRSVYAGY